MKIMLYGDLHVSHRNKDYMSFLNKTALWLKDIVNERKPDLLVNLGDTTDTFGVVDLRDAVWARELMTDLGQLQHHWGGIHFILRGNHDTADKEGRISCCPLLEGTGNLPIVYPGICNHREAYFLFLPYTKDYPRCIETIMKKAAEVKITAAFTHLDWTGCRLTPTFVSPEGLQPGVVADLLPKVPVFSGHYHMPMHVGPVHFVGSPLYANFSDEVGNIHRGVAFWDTNGHPDMVERLRNPHTYECWTIEAKTEKDLAKQLKPLEEKRDRCRVRVYVPKKLLDKAKEAGDGFLWWGVYPLDGEKQTVDFVASVSLKTTPTDAVQKAVDAAPEELDRVVLRKMGLEAFGVR